MAPLGTAMRAPPAVARLLAETPRNADAAGPGAALGFRSAAGEVGTSTEVSPGGFPDSALLPPIANTCSCDARPPPEDVAVPPTVIATNSLPPEEKIVGPAAIWRPVWKVHRILPVFESNARSTPSPPPAKPTPVAVKLTPPRSGSGVSNFHTRFPVEMSIALIEP